MSQIRHILVDMDGVMADFFGAALALWGRDMADYPPREWEIARYLGISVSDFWSKIDATDNFWRDIEPYPHLAGLLCVLNETGVPWTVSTSPSRDPRCCSQKVEWLRKHIDGRFHNYMIGHRKVLMARPDVLLIDDGEHNVDPFIEAGGQAILWPGIWNRRGHSETALADVARDLHRILDRQCA